MVEDRSIFATGYEQYALDAFRVTRIEYLLRPVKAGGLRRALEKLRRLTKSDRESYNRRVSDMAAQHNNPGVFLIHLRDKLIPLKADDIAFCYTMDEKVSVYTKDGRTLPYDKSLDTMMATLNDTDFFRANRQFIVARESIEDISVWFGSRLSLNLKVKTPERIIISKARVPEFKRWLTGGNA